MGACEGKQQNDPEDVNEAKENVKLTASLRKDGIEQTRVHRLLLLGTGECGKSTIFKQLRMIHSDGFRDEERQNYSYLIHGNVVDNMDLLVSCAISHIRSTNSIAKVSPSQNILAMQRCRVLFKTGFSEMVSGDYRAAVQTFSSLINEYEVIVSSDDSNNIPQLLHIIYSSRGFAQICLKHFNLSLKDANKAIDISPHYLMGHLLRGLSFIGLSKYDQSLLSLKKSIEIDPNNKQSIELLIKVEYIINSNPNLSSNSLSNSNSNKNIFINKPPPPSSPSPPPPISPSNSNSNVSVFNSNATPALNISNSASSIKGSESTESSIDFDRYISQYKWNIFHLLDPNLEYIPVEEEEKQEEEELGKSNSSQNSATTTTTTTTTSTTTASASAAAGKSKVVPSNSNVSTNVSTNISPNVSSNINYDNFEFDDSVTEPLKVANEWEKAIRFVKSLQKKTKHSHRPFISEKISVILTKIWNHECIQSAFENRAQLRLQVDDSISFFMQNLNRVGKLDYLPENHDIIMSRVKSSGISEMSFAHGQARFKITDVGGQRSERRKWLHLFQDAQAVIFVVALNEYDQVLAEDPRKNRLVEALELFDQMCNNQWLKLIPMILFLNKKDLFAEKIARVNINVTFPEYDGPQEEEAARFFLMHEFAKRNQMEKDIFVHVTCATDTNNITFVFEAVKDIVLQKNFRTAGF